MNVRLVTAFEIKVNDMIWLNNRWMKIEKIIDREHDSKQVIIHVHGDKDPFHLNGKDFFMVSAPITISLFRNNKHYGRKRIFKK